MLTAHKRVFFNTLLFRRPTGSPSVPVKTDSLVTTDTLIKTDALTKES